MSSQALQNTPTPFTPKFSASLVARFPALQQSKTSIPRQVQSQHKLLKRVAKPLAPRTKHSTPRLQVPHANKYLRRPVKRTFSGRVHDLNVAKIIRSSQKNGPWMPVEPARSKEDRNEARLEEFAAKQLEFREYMKQMADSRSVSPASVADSPPPVSSRESSPGLTSSK
ncbi:hypothetical protein CJU89_6380 [Yarrowia sp. B02]|nr:hypothetical protein CJU89_6380 [Yarrowia sp. B02]